jgi:hypothetical protein
MVKERRAGTQVPERSAEEVAAAEDDMDADFRLDTHGLHPRVAAAARCEVPWCSCTALYWHKALTRHSGAGGSSAATETCGRY